MSVGPVQRDDATAEFFDAAAAGRFLLRRCPAGHASEPAATQCTTCARTDLAWVEAGGGATLVSWAVTWSRPPDGEEPRRTILVIGELDEGPWWWTQLGGDQPGDATQLTPGCRLRIDFARADAEHEAVPVFVLA
jgi:uncharacterized OB-fold protein